MPAGFEFNLQDLAKIALGSPELTNVNVAVLHSLIEILLKKLNCQNETVSLGEFDSRHLHEILETAKMAPIAFNDENVEIISEKLDRLEKLEKELGNVDDKLDRHLEEMQMKNNVQETVFHKEDWLNYGCEDLCTPCDSDNEMACTLLKNTDFLKKLLRRISAPMVERMFKLEEKITQLNEEFNNYVKRAEEECLKIHMLEKCHTEIQALCQKIEDQNATFLCAMEEIQDILDTKMDKIHMPALKKYIRDNFNRIDNAINELQNKRQCPRAAGIIMENIRCACCGSQNVCSDVGVQPTGILPDINAKYKVKRKICHPSKKEVCRRSPDVDVKTLNLGDQVKIIRRIKIRRGEQQHNDPFPKCRKTGEDFELLEGFNGNLYRKG